MNEHSQSALEYMMTYGWAILIIVIVAGVLYSLGIFSPTSSASTTVTGFAGLGSVQAQCIGGQGLALQIGDSVGSAILIQNISVTSSGKTSIIYPQQTLTPNSLTSFYLPNLCPSALSRYSSTVKVFYTQLGSVFQSAQLATGTLSGLASSQQLSSQAALITAIPIILTNSQNTSTANPFQQSINVPASVYSGYANLSGVHSLQNVEFFYSNGTVIPSWLENYTTNNALWWLKVASIPSYSSITVYMGFASLTTNLFNRINVGEAPQIPTTYGQYDDGANVFVLYNNFSGTSLNSTEFQARSAFSGAQAGTYSVNNGLSISVNASESEAIITKNTYGIYNRFYGLGLATPSWSSSTNFAMVGSNGVLAALPAIIPSQNTLQVSNNIGNATSTATISNQGGTGNYLLTFNNRYSYGWFNSGSEIVANDYRYSYTNPDNVGLLNTYKAGVTFGPLYYFFITAPLNSSVMPSVSFGQPSQITLPANVNLYVPIIITNGQNTSVLNFQQMVTAPSSVYSSYANLSGVHSFQNVEFFYANGTVIPSWLENYTSSQAVWWLRLPAEIAYTSSVVYMGFVPKTTSLFNLNKIGEAPQLSSTYGQYDDGANIFNFYDNFTGTTLNSNLWGTEVGAAPIVSNSLKITETSGGATSAIASKNQYAANSYYFDADIIGGTAQTDSHDSGVFLSPTLPTSAASWSGAWGNNFVFFGIHNGPNVEVVTGSGGANTGNNNGGTYTYPVIGTASWQSSSSFIGVFNYGAISSATSSAHVPSLTMVYIDLGTNWGGNTNSYVIYQWVRARVYPPNGVMPSVSFGSVQ